VPPVATEGSVSVVSEAAPLTAAAFATAMADLGPFERAPAIAVGVSGGPDSTALALFLRDWVAERGGQLVAFVVDHRLRPESTGEALLTIARLAARGITARILTRTGPVPTSGLQAKAREARYALLEAATAETGILHLALAHHREDQAETITFRLAAGSGPRGAAGMPAIRELERIRLIRPLLGVAPQSLLARLEEYRVPWLEDPSNRDPRFWRARHRLASTTRPASTPPAAVAAARQALDAAVAAILAGHARPHPLGFVTIESGALLAQAPTRLHAVLERLLLATSGDAWPPSRAQLARLVAWLRYGTGRRTTLGGVLVERAGAALRFVREPRAVAGPVRLPAAGILWDGRFRITGSGPGSTLEVAAAGRGWRRRLARTALGVVHLGEAMRLPAIVLETLPLVSAGNTALMLGPWHLDTEAHGLRTRFRPRNRYTAVPFGQSVSASVASQGENLMYGSACGEASGQ